MKARQTSGYVLRTAASKLGRIIVLTGARQTGKTTLAKKIFPDYSYISVEDPVLARELVKLSAGQWRFRYPEAILDEVQKEPVLVESIKSVFDQWPEPRYVLTGSSQLLLLPKVKESLAGRCVIIELFPLTVPEIRTHDWTDKVEYSLFQNLITNKDHPGNYYPSFLLDNQMAEKMHAWEHYIRFGGYPVLTDPDLTDHERSTWLQQYVRTYLERDIRDLASFRDLEAFMKLQYSLAAQTGNMINASSLAAQTGISAKTVQRYLRYLEISYQTISIQAWSRNELKQLVKSPKVHFFDNGVRQAIAQRWGTPTGQEFESIVIAELFKQAKMTNLPVRFYHLRIQGGREIDLLLELENGYIAFEIKMTNKVVPADFRHFKDLGRILDKPLLHSFILSNDQSTVQPSPEITAVHAAMFLG